MNNYLVILQFRKHMQFMYNSYETSKLMCLYEENKDKAGHEDIYRGRAVRCK